MTVKELLEEHHSTKIHFLRTKKVTHRSVNGLAINWQTVVNPDDVCLIFDEEDYPQKTILFGNGELVEDFIRTSTSLSSIKPEGMKTTPRTNRASPS